MNSPTYYTTSRGVRVEFVPIAHLLDELDAWRLQNTPRVPTYTPEVAKGFVAEPKPHFHHYIKTIEFDPDTNQDVEVEKLDSSLETPDDFAQWEAYQTELTRVAQTYQTRYTQTVLLRGVRVEYPSDETWVREQEFMGYTVPADPAARKLHWLETEVIGTRADREAIFSGVLLQSGIDEEVVALIERSFRCALGRSKRHAHRRLARYPASQQSGVESLGTVRARRNRSQSKSLAERIRPSQPAGPRVPRRVLAHTTQNGCLRSALGRRRARQAGKRCQKVVAHE